MDQKQKKTNDPATARYLRKQYADQGFDDQEQQQEREFSKNLSKAVNTHSKHISQKSLQDQINYFGTVIQPFHMKKEQQMGQIDEQGFFIFHKRGRNRDAWLQSIKQAEDQQIAQKIRKKIKTQGRYRNVYQGTDQINKQFTVGIYSQDDLQQGQQQQQQESQNNINQQESSNRQENTVQFQPKEIIQLLISLLPDNKSANQYLKKLKQDKNTQLYQKIITLCSLYIEKTQDHQILTKKKEDLQQQIENQENEKEKSLSEQLNWNNQDDQKQKQQKIKEKEKTSKNNQNKLYNNENNDNENDDVF